MRRESGQSFLSVIGGVRRIGRIAVIGGLAMGLASSTAFAQGTPPAKQPPAGAQPPAKDPPKKPLPKMNEKQKAEAAGKLFNEGKTKMAAGDFAGAYEAFKAADELVPQPVPKFRMAEALDKKGDVDGAIAAYENFLASKPGSETDGDKLRIQTANDRIAALKNTPADVKVVITPPEAATATLSVDGAPATGNPVKVPPGKHTITATLAGFEDAKVDVEVNRGEQKEVTITLTPKPADVAGPAGPDPDPGKGPTDKKPEQASSGSSLIPAIVTLSLAGAGVVVGAVFGGLALKSKSDFEATPTQDLFDETERNALIADMSFGVALTFGVTGVVLLLTDSGGDEPAEEKKAAVDWLVVPFATPDAAGAVGRVTF